MSMLLVAPPVHREESLDGTVKYTFSGRQNAAYEACSLNLPYRRVSRVICVSTQIGCPFDCTFCAIGARPFLRNLSATEILEQISVVSTDPTWCHQNFEVAAMGTGEPLLALQELTEAITSAKIRFSRLCSLNVSTIGLPAKIREYSKIDLSGVELNLQLSLHGSSDPQRQLVMPRASTAASLISILDACEEFASTHSRRVVVNYLLLEGVNDTIIDAHRLAKLLSPDRFSVKVSALNTVPNAPVIGAGRESLALFSSVLRDCGLEARVFVSVGSDIGAGCGQFSNAPL
jgi:23S rRNA (adenine2503-C2)-methyltransferase